MSLSTSSSLDDIHFILSVYISNVKDPLYTHDHSKHEHDIWSMTDIKTIDIGSVYDYITPDVAEINHYIISKLSKQSSDIKINVLLDRVISKIITLTNSQIGTISIQSSPDLPVICVAFGEICPGIVNIDIETKHKSNKGFFAQIIQKKSAVIINEKIQTPDDHHNITKFIAIPIVNDKDTCKCILALANSNDDYSIDTIKQLLPLLPTLEKLLRYNKHSNNVSYNIKQKSATEYIKDEFWATMSHELRTPLNGILPLIAMFPETGKLNDKQQEYLRRLTDCTLQLSNLLNNILDFSKMSASRMALASNPFSLADAIQNARNIIEPTALSKKLQCIFDVPNELPMFIGDSQRITQILINLLSNGVKFTESGFIALQLKLKKLHNSISLNSPHSKQTTVNKHDFARQLTTGWTDEWNSSSDEENEVNIIQSSSSSIGGSWICQFEISDSGIGIDTNEQEKIFEVFHQSNNISPYLSKSGTGLGLSISRELIKMMGGKISVKSEGIPGRGSTFMFYIKLQEEINIPNIQKLYPDLFTGTRILIVDDRPEMRLQLTDIVFKWGCEPVTVSSAEEALQYVKNNVVFKIALIDICMPYMSGVELAQELRRISPNLPLIGISSIELEDPSGEQYFDIYMYKPIDQNRLFAAVFKCLKYGSIYQNHSTSPLHQTLLRQSLAKEHIKILIAEDNANNSFTIKEMLLSLGYKNNNIKIVSNGLECIKESKLNKYNVILMDIVMPKMDGIEAAKHIRQYQHHPMIIAVSASVQSNDKTRCQRVGIDGYLEKPFTREQLEAALSPLLL